MTPPDPCPAYPTGCMCDACEAYDLWDPDAEEADEYDDLMGVAEEGEDDGR